MSLNVLNASCVESNPVGKTPRIDVLTARRCSNDGADLLELTYLTSSWHLPDTPGIRCCQSIVQL